MGALQALDGTEVLNAGTVSAILVKFLYLFVASMGLGLAFGLGTSWLMKTFKSNSTPQVQQACPWSTHRIVHMTHTHTQSGRPSACMH